MRILLDLQGAQTASRFRGIGRYSLSFAEHVVKSAGRHEVYIALNQNFPESINAIKIRLSPWLSESRFLYFTTPTPVADGNPGNGYRRQAAELIREALFEAFQFDIIHICSVVEGSSDDAVTSIARLDTQTLVTVTGYDLIPLIFADDYLKYDDLYARHYREKIEYFTVANAVFAISESAANEFENYLSVDKDRICHTPLGIDDVFLSAHSESYDRQHLARLSLPQWFILYVGGTDHRKNIPRLIQAYAKLDIDLRIEYPLVIAGHISDDEAARIVAIARSASVSNHVIFTNFISDKELASLYRLATLLVFPSWHEGFGLPALEALISGTPVIAANCSSLPEVVSDPNALFDPFTVSAIYEKLHQALADQGFREALLANSMVNARRFTWDATARSAFDAWESLLAERADKTPIMGLINYYQQTVYPRLMTSLSELALHAQDPSLLIQCADAIAKNELQLQRFSELGDATWFLEGPINDSYSLALVNREFARASLASLNSVSILSADGPGAIPLDSTFADRCPDLVESVVNEVGRSDLKPSIHSRNMYPPRCTDMRGTFNLLHAYGWEESQFPFNWASDINNSLDGLSVMSTHVQKVLIDSGVSVPTIICGLGTDHWDRVVPSSDYVAPFKLQSGIKFIHISSGFPRKGVDLLLEAWAKAFTINDDVELVIKTFPNEHNSLAVQVHHLTSTVSNLAPISVVNHDLTDAELKALMAQCDVMVLPARAEGFCLPAVEAILTGLPVIMTRWGGQMDFIDCGAIRSLDFRFEFADTHFKQHSSVWASASLPDLVSALRESLDAGEEHRRQEVAIAADWLRAKFQWKYAAERTQSLVSYIGQGRHATYPIVGWVSSWNTRCGIAGYSRFLVKDMSLSVKLFGEIVANGEQIILDDENVTRCWMSNDVNERLSHLSEALERSEMDVVVIQFNFYFFEFTALAHIICRSKQLGRKVVITLHSTVNPPDDPSKSLALLKDALRLCDRVIVHSIHDMNRLKDIDVVENVTLFPHGVINQPARINSQSIRSTRTFVVTSFGFCLPHKGLVELISAIRILIDKGYDVELHMMNALHSAPLSALVAREIERAISAFELHESVCFDSAFLDDAEVFSRISAADLIVFPYQNTGESSSAAVRHGIASGVPVCVTPLAIFEDVLPAVNVLSGVTPEDLADGIADLINRWHEGETLLAPGYDSWRAAHEQTNVSKRFEGLLTGLYRALT